MHLLLSGDELSNALLVLGFLLLLQILASEGLVLGHSLHGELVHKFRNQLLDFDEILKAKEAILRDLELAQRNDSRLKAFLEIIVE